ncbi:hypothetical protein GCM10023084_78250 [Streptomyces lacrimifluminis]|uniref:Uncharacterized protein n=1 Tax=Streptomyces lacrimifluminis TaxID=1500077 RepID=A0A917PAH3_9ACTN|nr:hypothetical protein GCM10012282_77050 [Streptomyces lacrimifluminis]
MRNVAADLPDDPTPEQDDVWAELAELLQDLEFTARMRAVAFNAADRGRDAEEGASLWFAQRMIKLAADARARGVAPGEPEAAEVLRDLVDDADPAGELARLESPANETVARYRELPLAVKGQEPPAAHREEFAWVVAALRAHLAS